MQLLFLISPSSQMRSIREVLKRVLEIQKLSGDDKEHILFTLDALLRDAKTRMAYA